jgi:hypothetical protein
MPRAYLASPAMMVEVGDYFQVIWGPREAEDAGQIGFEPEGAVGFALGAAGGVFALRDGADVAGGVAQVIDGARFDRSLRRRACSGVRLPRLARLRVVVNIGPLYSFALGS